jgi:hypothetical protein
MILIIGHLEAKKTEKNKGQIWIIANDLTVEWEASSSVDTCLETISFLMFDRRIITAWKKRDKEKRSST